MLIDEGRSSSVYLPPPPPPAPPSTAPSRYERTAMPREDAPLQPATTLAKKGYDYERPGPQAYSPPAPPKGDGTFAASVAGTRPKKDIDIPSSLMSNDVYSDWIPANAGINSDSARELRDTWGWNRMSPVELLAAGFDPETFDDPNSGLQAAIYQNEQGQYVIAFAGTEVEADLLNDGRTDLVQALGLRSMQYNQATALTKDALLAFGEGNVAVTGQSLGGGLAATSALGTGVPAITFNAAGVSNDTIRDLGYNPNEVRDAMADNGQIRRYVVDGDPLTAAQQGVQIGNKENRLTALGFAPDALGHELRLDTPPGTTPVYGAHGGGGPDAPYVLALKTAFVHGTVREADPDSLMQGIIEHHTETFFSQVGNVVENIDTSIRQIDGVLKATHHEMKATAVDAFAKGEYSAGATRIAGDAIDGTMDTFGILTGRRFDLGGDIGQDFLEKGGRLVRDISKNTPLDSQGKWLARHLEDAGVGWQKVMTNAGLGVEWLFNSVGDKLESLADSAAPHVQAFTDRVERGFNRVASWSD